MLYNVTSSQGVHAKHARDMHRALEPDRLLFLALPHSRQKVVHARQLDTEKSVPLVRDTPSTARGAKEIFP